MNISVDSAGYFAFAALCGFCICVYFAWRDFRYARALSDTPTAKTRSAPQGYVELVGHAQPGPQGLTVAPLSGVSCLWYRYGVEKKGSKGKWATLHRGVSDHPFLILDSTGECLIFPKGAKVVKTRRTSWRGDEPMYQNQPAGGILGSAQAVGQFLNSISIGSQRYRYTEYRIMPGDPLHALGHFRTVGGAAELPDQRRELAGLLEGWKRDEKRMALFDRNGDGNLDVDEWGAAVAAAERQLSRDILSRPDGPVIHTLSNPTNHDRPFLLSTASESSLVRGYRIRAAAATAGLAISGGCLVLLFA